MEKILTDMGTEYINKVLQKICDVLKINEYLRSVISNDKSDWDERVKFFVYCYNTSPSTVHEYWSFELIFVKIPTDLKFLGNDNIEL